MAENIEVCVQEEVATVSVSEVNTIKGDAGGYYKPSVSSDGRLDWTASQSGMPTVASANIKGEPGNDGKDGISPTVSVKDVSGGYSVTITDVNGTHSFTIVDGEPGTDAKPWLAGSTDSITPLQVAQALADEQNVIVQHTGSPFGTLTFFSFIIAQDINLLMASAVATIGDELGVCQLTGDLSSDTWQLALTNIAKRSDIPDYLPNPNFLHIKDSSGNFLVSYDGGTTKTVTLPDAKTPVKGTDYWTEADQESMVQQVIAALGTPVVGFVDEENNIILSGSLTGDTYTFKYEDASGNLIYIGTLNGGGTVVYVNQLKESIDSDGQPYNGGTGWKADTRLNSSGAETTAVGTEVTGFMPFAIGDVWRFKDIKITGTDSTNTTQYIVFYDANFAKVKHVYTHQLYEHSGQTAYFTLDSNGYWKEYNTHNIKSSDASVDWDSVKYFRISAEEITNDSIITINQAIT